MLISKGTKLIVSHSRKGRFMGVASEDFDSETAEWFPIKVAQPVVFGMVNEWEDGESIPCRASLCKIEKVRYLVTDPCYLIDGQGLDSDWDKFLSATNMGDNIAGWLLPDKGIILDGGGTSYGDGVWEVGDGKKVMADAGMVCILQIAYGYRPTDYEGNAITEDYDEALEWLRKVQTT